MPQGYLSVRLLHEAFLLVLAGCARDQQAERAGPEPPRPTARSTTARLKRIPVKVLVPCGLASAFRDLAGQIHDDLPDIALTTRTLPVVEMTDKVLSGEIEADVFTTLGHKEIERLRKAGKLARGSVRNFARFRLALIVIRGNPLGVTELQDLLKPEVKHVTMPPPHENSVGYYTQDVLRRAGLWEQLEPKLVYPEESAQVIKYMREGWADAAIIYNTCLIETYTPTGEPKHASTTVEKVAIIGPALYPTLYAAAAILINTDEADAANRVIKYLLSDAAGPCFRKYGYLPPEESDEQ